MRFKHHEPKYSLHPILYFFLYILIRFILNNKNILYSQLSFVYLLYQIKRNKVMERRFLKLNGIVFLVNTTNEVLPNEGTDLSLATDGDYVTLYELMDITTEMKNGVSYSIYMDNLSYLTVPSMEEIEEANNFLNGNRSLISAFNKLKSLMSNYDLFTDGDEVHEALKNLENKLK